MHAGLLAALAAWLCSSAPVSGSLVVLVRSPVTVRRGHKATLPCWIDPPQSAEGLEVRWYRPHKFETPVMLYLAKQFENASQDASYAGRVSFGLKEAASGGLKAGDVSLQLANVTPKDAGDYTCYSTSDEGYDSASVTLTVRATGGPVRLSAVWKEDNTVNVSCASGGWYPEPSLRWVEQKQNLTPKGLSFSKESSGLLTVHSWLLVSSPSEVSCSVGLSGEEATEASVHLQNPPQPESGSSVVGWIFFALAMLVLAALGALYYFKKRGKKCKSGRDHGDAEENQKLLIQGVIQPTAASVILSTKANKNYVNVALDKTGNEYLTIKDNRLRDGQNEFPDGRKVTCLTAIKGTPAFSSGEHYWEVHMGATNVGFKQSWWVGVTSAAVIPPELDSPTTSKGFWFLSSSPDRADSFLLSTEPNVFLPVHSRPQTVGVYLNYDSGELSFYDVEGHCLIGSLAATFTGQVFPFFNPGKGDKAVMEILQRKEAPCSDIKMADECHQ